MKKVFLLCAAVLLSMPVIPAFAEDPVEVRAELTKNIEQLYSMPQMRGITDSCRAKSKEINADEKTMKEYADTTYNIQEATACLLGFILYKNGKMGEWSNADAVDLTFKHFFTQDFTQEYIEKGYCATIKADLRNYVTYLLVYYADNSSYPKNTNFTIENGKDKKVFSQLNKETVIDYKPSKDYQKFSVKAHSQKCPTIYSKSSDSAEIVETKKSKPAKKK